MHQKKGSAYCLYKSDVTINLNTTALGLIQQEKFLKKYTTYTHYNLLFHTTYRLRYLGFFHITQNTSILYKVKMQVLTYLTFQSPLKKPINMWKR